MSKWIPSEKALMFMRRKRIVTLAEMTEHLSCSDRTAHRRFKEWGVIKSYNKNGSYYTLPDIPEFDVNGIWKYHGVFFSRFGNLHETFIKLVENSKAGLSASESGDLLGVNPSSFLSSLREHSALKREIFQKCYVHYSSDPTVFNTQRQQRNKMLKASKLPTNAEAVAILAAKIQNPELTNEELSKQLKKQRIHVKPEAIHNLFVRYDLAEKKTAPSI